MQSLILSVEEADSSYKLARTDAVNWFGLTVKKIKAKQYKSFFAKAGFGESDVADILRRQVKKLLQYLISAEKNELSCDPKRFLRSDDHLSSHTLRL
jgi:hypothetical protein